ncbi:MAG: autotransporter outer membrane beta-barrel domain-containing protein, partial [Pseudomonadota bacterium]
ADAGLGAALSSLVSEDDFFSGYSQVLPHTSDAALRYLATQNSLATGVVGQRLSAVRQLTGPAVDFWAQQTWTYLDSASSLEHPGYDGLGLSLAAGADRRVGSDSRVGVGLTLSFNEFEEDDDPLNEIDTTTVLATTYGATDFGGVQLDVAGGVGWVGFNSQRRVEFGELEDQFDASWDGWAATVSARLSYPARVGSFALTPQLTVDYSRLHQGAYSENAADEEDAESGLRITTESATSDLLNGAAIVVLAPAAREGQAGDLRGRARSRAGAELRLSPRAYGGVRANLGYSPYETTARFDGSDVEFALRSEEEAETTAVFGFGVQSQSTNFLFSFGYDGEFSDELMIHQLNGSMRFFF